MTFIFLTFLITLQLDYILNKEKLQPDFIFFLKNTKTYYTYLVSWLKMTKLFIIFSKLKQQMGENVLL